MGAPQNVHFDETFSGSFSLIPNPDLKTLKVSLSVSAKTSTPKKLLSPNDSKLEVSPVINLIKLEAHFSVSLALSNPKLACPPL